MPAFHLEKIACTTCHSGPMPAPEVGLFQTARAHGLGLKTFRNLDARKRPAVMAPIFMRDENSIIRPHAAIWPAMFGIRKDGEIEPLSLQRVREAVQIVRPAVQQLEQLRVRQTGETNWIEAQKKDGRTPPPEEVVQAGKNALIVWQENKAKGMTVGLTEPFEQAKERLKRLAEAEGRRVTEEEVRNALDLVRAERALREETELRKLEVPLVLKYLAMKDKAAKEQDKSWVDYLPPTSEAKPGEEKPVSLQIKECLATQMTEFSLESPYVYLAGGRIYQADGAVVDNAYQAAPHAWPIAHDVRGAGESLGAKGCSDCHGLHSPFFFGLVKAQPTGPGGDRMELKQCTMMGLSSKAIKVGALAVKARELFVKKIWFFLLAGLLVLALMHYLVVELRGPVVASADGKAPFAFRWTSFSWIGFCSVALLALLCATGVGFLLTYGPAPLFKVFTTRDVVKLHVVGGFIFTFICAFVTLRWMLGAVRDPAVRNGAGGLLWPVKPETEMSLLAKIRCRGWCWVLLDILCFGTLACTGFIMAGRVPPIGDKIHILERLVEHRFIGPMAYAVHGAVGSFVVVRLLGHLYARLVLHKRKG
jgi:hypothetical protein